LGRLGQADHRADAAGRPGDVSLERQGIGLQIQVVRFERPLERSVEPLVGG
jgi:hypothetical protein